MKAVRLVEIGEPLEAQEIPLPTVGPCDVLVQVKAAGICHSDVHYRAGTSPVGSLPQTLGHEVAGVVAELGPEVGSGGLAVQVGDRVCLHYLLTCGQCHYCRTDREQFCVHGQMIGKHTDGGYAEYLAVPARNAVALPPEIPFEQGAVLMCSSSTSFHALQKSRLKAGETVAVYGVGGLGTSAIQLARAMGALRVYAVDIAGEKLKLAERLGAVPVDAAAEDPVAQIRRWTDGRGVDVALEVIGLRQTMEQSVQSLAIQGRAVLAGIANQPLAIDSYRDLLGREAEVIGSADHLLWELPILVDLLRQGRLDLSHVVTRTVPLQAEAINGAMDDLEQFGGQVRTVIVPEA
jgi:2-desacetyl-2-hydroxyethyl bacteriochlorophyllide A dehydrogenase